MNSISTTDGFLNVADGRIYYVVHSAPQASGTPLILIHGGPGFAHYYLQNLHVLASDQPVILYDQLGCGASERPVDDFEWNVSRFTDELRSLVTHLGYDSVSLLGHSWGSAVAAEYISSGFPVSKVIFASPWLSESLWMKDAVRFINKLSAEHREAIVAAWQSNDFSAPEFNAAYHEYYGRHVYRGSEDHPDMRRSAQESGSDSYLKMWGPNEFTVSGVLKGYEAGDKIRQIDIPVLFTCGRYDEASPEACNTLASKISDCRVRVFENSAHFPHISEKQEYIKTLREFLNSATARRPGGNRVIEMIRKRLRIK